MRTKTVVQHEDQLIRSGLVHVLNQEPDIEVVAQVATPAELVGACGEQRPDAVLLQIDVADYDAPRLAAALRKRQRTLRLVGLHACVTPEVARRAYQAGVRTMVSYDVGTRGVVGALRGNRRPAPPVTSLRTAAPTSTLTPREIDIVRLIAEGHLTREIGAELGITAKTVENHKQRIFRKLDVQNQAHAVSIAIRRGLLGPSVAMHRG